jgi:tetratricopeptide (TPR) repeat protein
MPEKNQYEQSETICPLCNAVVVLEAGEIDKGEYECPECNKTNAIDESKLRPAGETAAEDDSDFEIEPKKSGSRTGIYIGIAVIVLAALSYFAYESDYVPFLNKKVKSDKHVAAGKLIMESQMQSQQTGQQPDPKVFESALTEFKKAVDIDKDNTDALLNLGIAYASTGKFKEAIEEINKVINVKKDMPEAYLYRALCNMQTGNIQGALPDFDKALELNPADLNTVFYRANAKYSLQDFKGAIDDVNKIIESDPKFPNGFAFRGMCKIGLGDKTGCDDLKKAKELGMAEADQLIEQNCK